MVKTLSKQLKYTISFLNLFTQELRVITVKAWTFADSLKSSCAPGISRYSLLNIIFANPNKTKSNFFVSLIFYFILAFISFM